MKLWIDAQLSPALAPWLSATFNIEASHVRDHGLLTAEDQDIFQAARSQNVAVMSKDRDFVELVTRLGPPPQVIWVTCGNTSNARMKEILGSQFDAVLALLSDNEPLVEICDAC